VHVPRVLLVDSPTLASVIATGLPVIVDLFAPGCGPCRALLPELEALAVRLEGRVRFVKVDLAESPEVGDALGVSSVPTLIAFRRGDEVDRKVGAPTRPVLERWALDLSETRPPTR
jgi:thioredoxin